MTDGARTIAEPAASPVSAQSAHSAPSSRVVELLLGDVVRLRRAHPCGSRDWTVDRVGADIGLRCLGCGHHVLMDRRSLERRLVTFMSRGDRAMTEALSPRPRDEAAS